MRCALKSVTCPAASKPLVATMLPWWVTLQFICPTAEELP